uniref:Uncharacterized protein n=1 Tax=Neovison vison TaxID=452646 RepID=A0A8C7BHZ2_NEOVI
MEEQAQSMINKTTAGQGRAPPPPFSAPPPAGAMIPPRPSLPGPPCPGRMPAPAMGSPPPAGMMPVGLAPGIRLPMGGHMPLIPGPPVMRLSHDGAKLTRNDLTRQIRREGDIFKYILYYLFYFPIV